MMKKAIKFSWPGFAVLAVLLVGWLFYGCGGGGGGGGTQPNVGAAKIAAQIVDAKDDTVLSTGNGGPAGGFDVTFSVNGSTLGSVVNTKTGVVTYLTSNLTVGTVVSAEFVAKDATGKNDPNFLRNSQSYTISQKGTNDFTNNKILITNLNNLPPDVIKDKQLGTVVNCAVATTIVLSPTPAVAGDPVPTVTIPAGAELKDANGQCLTNGSITANLVYYPSTSANALQNFPGGLDNIIQTNGNIGAFITGGFLALEITDSAGTVASSVSGAGKQIEITMEISSQSVNPDTGNPVQVGDKLPLWSFDTKKGRWKKDATATVTAGGNTGLLISYGTNHLSYWNLDWIPKNTCTGKISFSGNTVPLLVIIKATDTKKWGYLSMLYQPANDNTANVRYVPSGMSITVEAYSDGVLVGSVTTSNWCGEPNKTLYLAVNILNPINRSVRVHYYCPTSPSTQSPAAGIPILLCRKTGSGKYRNCEPVGSTDVNGYLAFAVTDHNKDKVTVAIYHRDLHEAVSDIIGLPNNDVCVTGGTGGTGGSGTGDDF
jgi:hypothetical protein